MDSVSLAEPRRRQKWTLNPRGNMWANDESKFGQKLMEKMGWSKGKGLGANEDGRVQHVSLKLKDNNKGVGFEGHDDTWLAHQSDFQNVLAALNIEHGDKGKDMSEVEKKANLEEISKKSKRRVHYQKFVRGKDTNNYSADDLGCILGTKSEKVKLKSEPSSPEAEEEQSEESGGDNEDEQKFVQGGNYTDYFAKKMADLKARGKLTSVPSCWTQTTQESPKDEVGDDQVVRAGFGTSKSIQPEDESNEAQEPTKKKKKSKKSKKDEHKSECTEEKETIEIPCESKKKKSKKQKKKEEPAVTEVPDAEEEISVKKKKSKKSKDREVFLVSEELPEKTKKKSKKKQKERTDSVISSNSSDDASEDLKKKKSKKSKKEREVSDEIQVPDPDSGCEDEDIKYKKAKKIKKEKTKEKKTTYSDEEKENRKRKTKPETGKESSSKRVRGEAEPPQSSDDTKFAGFKGSNFLSIPGYGK